MAQVSESDYVRALAESAAEFNITVNKEEFQFEMPKEYADKSLSDVIPHNLFWEKLSEISGVDLYDEEGKLDSKKVQSKRRYALDALLKVQFARSTFKVDGLADLFTDPRDREIADAILELDRKEITGSELFEYLSETVDMTKEHNKTGIKLWRRLGGPDMQKQFAQGIKNLYVRKAYENLKPRSLVFEKRGGRGRKQDFKMTDYAL